MRYAQTHPFAFVFHSRAGPSRRAAFLGVLEDLEPRALLSGDPIAALVAEVQVADYTGVFAGLPVDQGAQRGYNADKTPQAGLVAARTTILNALTSALGPGGGTVTTQSFTSGAFTGVNIVGVLPGHGPNRNQQVLIGAHYDSVQNAGADDDASGVAGLIEAAKVMGDGGHLFDRTIVFVAFDQEEARANGSSQGSRVYATAARNAGTSIAGTYVMDMIAFNANPARPVVTVGYPSLLPFGSSAALASEVAYAYRTYTGLKNVNVRTTLDRTDAYSFYQKGYAGVSTVEALNLLNPVNPYYHTNNDFYRRADGTVQTLNGRAYLDFAYATDMTRGTVAAAAAKAQFVTGPNSRSMHVHGGTSVPATHQPWISLVQAFLSETTPIVRFRGLRTFSRRA